ncbi:2Fe-2S iron-sulfur cluster binding domain-containing protein [Rhodococcus sp. M8]|nr:hypothetical protein BKE56_013815 [Rhodococcus sp. M8]QPG48347.1 2Fe-2S iron-sulfur cluster binding domain-containing protein [Rhodococcus sp. M8]
MPRIIYTLEDSTVYEVDAPVGYTLMEAATENDVPGIPAECGGNMICGTCHVQVEPEWADKLDGAGTYEEDLLGSLPNHAENSRLSCQLEVRPELDGIVVRIPGVTRGDQLT